VRGSLHTSQRVDCSAAIHDVQQLTTCIPPTLATNAGSLCRAASILVGSCVCFGCWLAVRSWYQVMLCRCLRAGAPVQAA
jgi:hypothetical protein